MALTWAGVVLNGCPVFVRHSRKSSKYVCQTLRVGVGRVGGWVGGWGYQLYCGARLPATHMRLMSRDSVLDVMRGIGSSISIAAAGAGRIIESSKSCAIACAPADPA